MTDERKKFYITTPIYYVNDRPHIGHAYATIAADAIARFQRARRGEECVWLLTGTDEHGAKIAEAAERAGKRPQEFADDVSALFRLAWRALHISANDFIRTTEGRHERAVIRFLGELSKAETPRGNPAVFEGTYEGLYCTPHEAFLKESDLADGLCPDHKTKPELVREKNWFFRLSDYGDYLTERIESGGFEIAPPSRRNEVLSFIRQGLEDIAISRPHVSWGIPVPFDPSQTVYVWVDALVNYISAIGYASDESRFNQWWPVDLHLIGKDIIKFHCIIWPALLEAAGLELPKRVFAHGFFTISGEKISKTVGNVIDPVALAERYGTDPVRYFLIREIPFGEDGDFSEAKLRAVYNGELANGIGNLVARVATLGEKVSPLALDFPHGLLPNVREAIHGAFRGYEGSFASFRLHEAVAEVWRLIGFTDRYLNAASPWALGDTAEFKKVIVNAAYLVSTVSNLLRPFLPETADKIQEQIRFEDSAIHIKRGAMLFPRLE